MYHIGDLVVYGTTGVCRILDITARAFSRSEKSQDYYVLSPIYQEHNKIYTPVEAKIFMRPVISKEEAEDLIALIPTIDVEIDHSHLLNELEEHYKASMRSHDLADLLALTMSIYAKRQEVVDQKRKLGVVDERFMKLAEELLFTELAVALDIPRETVPAYIERKINGPTAPERQDMW
ncbi:MAG: CarD family transcriptional regulator [Oscillospiraceae bacterium]|jgi:CarD family transcriptional regulator|nr:CarD family transcriptional regulator [Oscillospiraceae bacterium]